MCTTDSKLHSCVPFKVMQWGLNHQRRLTRIFLVLQFGKVSTAFCWDEPIHFSNWMFELPLASCPRHRTWRNFWIWALPVGGSPSLFLFLNFTCVLWLHTVEAPEISDASVPQGLLVEVLWFECWKFCNSSSHDSRRKVPDSAEL